MSKKTLYAKHVNISITFRNAITWEDRGKWVKEGHSRIFIFVMQSRAQSCGGRFAYARAYACRAVSRARAHAAITQIYQRAMRDARPILIPFIALLLPSHSPRISIFSLFRRGAPGREDDTRRENEKRREKTRRDRESWERSRKVSQYRDTVYLESDGRAGGSGIFGFSKNVPSQFSLFPS